MFQFHQPCRAIDQVLQRRSLIPSYLEKRFCKKTGVYWSSAAISGSLSLCCGGSFEDINHGIYTHDVIVHQEHFVDPNDDAIHTQNVENLWMRVKRKLRRQFGTSETLFTSHLHEFVRTVHSFLLLFVV